MITLKIVFPLKFDEYILRVSDVLTPVASNKNIGNILTISIGLIKSEPNKKTSNSLSVFF